MEFMSKRVNYFIAVAQEGSITKAADRLCITPSPLSKRIKELEENLNITLFERTNQGLSLTKEGQNLYKKLISHYEELKLVMENHKGNRHIQIGVYGPTPSHVNIVINYLLIKKPDVIINLVRITSMELVSLDITSRLNLLFSIEPLLNSSFNQHLCSEERLLLLYPAGESIERLRSLPWVQGSYFSETSIFQQCHEDLQRQGFSKELMCIDNLCLRLNMIRQGKAIALVPESKLPCMNVDEKRFRTILLPNKKLTHHIYSNMTYLNDKQHIVSYLEDQSSLYWK